MEDDKAWTATFGPILEDLRALVHFPEVGRRSGLVTDDDEALVPLERLRALVEGADALAAVEQRATNVIADGGYGPSARSAARYIYDGTLPKAKR